VSAAPSTTGAPLSPTTDLISGNRMIGRDRDLFIRGQMRRNYS
jgi:hypothetical protein